MAHEASGRWNLTKSLLQTVLFWTLFLIVLPFLIYEVESRIALRQWRFAGEVSFTAGIILFLPASCLGLWSCTTMALIGRGTPLPLDSPRELVIAGPYQYVRNPMAVAGISQGIAVGLLCGSPAILLYALIGAPTWHIFVRPLEEQDLEERFGDAYRTYRRRVSCWMPRFNNAENTDIDETTEV